MAFFNADVNGYYAPAFEAATLADAISYANEHYLGIPGCPREYTEKTVCLYVNNQWVPAWLVEWTQIDAEWAKPLAEKQAAERHAVQAAWDAWCAR